MPLRHRSRADIGGAMDHLALQVGEIDCVIIDYPEVTDAGGCEIFASTIGRPRSWAIRSASG